MRRRFLLAFLLFTVVILVGLEVPLGLAYRQREHQAVIDSLERDATAMSAIAVDDLEHGGLAHLTVVARQYAWQADAGVTVFDPQGRVLVAEGHTPSTAITSGLRAELARALQGATPSGLVHRPGPDLLYVATPIGAGRSSLGVTVVAATTTKLEEHVRRNWIELGAAGAVALAVGAGLGLLLARSLMRPLAELDDAVAGIGAGDLKAWAAAGSGPPELEGIVQRFNAMADRIEELVEAQQSFVADASHQLRTPLTALRLRLENLDLTVAEGDHADLEAAIAEAHRLSRLVDGLLALARVEGSRPVRDVVDTVAIVEDRVQVWEPLASERGVSLRDRVPARAPALAVAGFVEQVLDNLIANALDASPTNTAVEVLVERRDSWVEVHVVDEGPGLSENERLRAFDRFWRQNGATQGVAAGNEQGTGLGLAIVRQLVRSSGGEVELQRAASGGLEAVVRLESAGEGAARSAEAVPAQAPT